jgi:hypothetical protein
LLGAARPLLDAPQEVVSDVRVTLRRLIYTSRVARAVRFADAEAIASGASARNQQAGLTGLLLYTPSHFVQVLEGPSHAVQATLSRIKRDPRHSDLRVIGDQEVEAREFGPWFMTTRYSGVKPDQLESLTLAAALELLRTARAG